MCVLRAFVSPSHVFVSIICVDLTRVTMSLLMLQICREQFVSLHSQPILEELSHVLINKFGFDERFVSDNDIHRNNIMCRCEC